MEFKRVRSLELSFASLISVAIFLSNSTFGDRIIYDNPLLNIYGSLNNQYQDDYELNNDPYDLIHQDYYESNSTTRKVNQIKERHHANLAEHERTWLSNLYGLAVQDDEDWYAIEITPGFLNLEINLVFNHSQGNIDLEVYSLRTFQDISGNQQLNISFAGIGSYSFENNEYINTSVSDHGIYFIKVFGQDAGNEYNFWWDDHKTRTWDDAFELNDDYSNAYDITTFNGDPSGIKQIDFGIQYNNDFYSVNISKGFERLYVFLTYDFSEGMMGFKIYDKNMNEVTSNFTMNDNDYVDYILPSNGIYFIRIFGDNTGNTYNLFWESRRVEETNIVSIFYLFLLTGVIIGIIMLILLKYSDKVFD